ncbi:MAG: anthranilate synthase component I [Rhizobiaceae bacterium]|nr:anthranilate synthase component I [Rhizobiaceae bacterium]
MVSATLEFETSGGVHIRRESFPDDYATAIDKTLDRVNSQRGAVLSSNYEYPGRYTRWDTAIVNPPLGIEARGRDVKITAYNARGQIFLEPICKLLDAHEHVQAANLSGDTISVTVRKGEKVLSEEMRSRAPTVFSVVRAIVDLFRSSEDPNLGLFGAFGYDLVYQFDDLEFRKARPEDQRDLVLFLPDEILMVDHHQAIAWHDKYDFTIAGKSTHGIPRESVEEPFKMTDKVPPAGDHEKGEYAKLVTKAKEKFVCGDLFEVVPGQVFYERCTTEPAQISRKLKTTNPSPYSFFINLGNQEYLVGASPEMFVRVSGRRIETCPISGTIKRGRDAIEDSEQIIKLLNSKKDESELTMCSDVDRNDKSRVCEPGSVKVIGRRQIEMYSKLIHTVDHIEGRLREDMDAFDGFLSHAWAVTVTGAPKLWAMRYIEEHERTTRAWYGGAVGIVHFNGDMNTGLTLRTVRIKDGIAEVRAGATLLYDSDPDEEERETELKASAMLAAIREAGKPNDAATNRLTAKVGQGRKILLVDHEDSFVHTLGNYFRQTGAEVLTVRSPLEDSVLDEYAPDLVVLSPGPGSPSDFSCSETIRKARARDLPVFGVCLGLQAIAESHGGKLLQLDVPMHGKPSRVEVLAPGVVFSGLEKEITIGRYHSLHVDPEHLPDGFLVSAVTSDGIVMGIEHETEPVAAVQFHPESIMSLGGEAGMRIIENVVAHLGRK